VVVSALEGHRLWAPAYDADPNPVLALESRVLGEKLEPIPQRRFVDIACGTGRWMSYIQQRGGTVFGIDLSGEMLAEARRKSRLRGSLALADAACLPFRTGFADVTLCSFAAGYLPHLNDCFAELARITIAGGNVIVSDLHPQGIALGWTRSFRAGTTHYEMQHFSPTVDRLRAAGAFAGLTFQQDLDVYFGEEERQLFVASGKEARFASVRMIPAVWIGVWVKR
jgi:ubiquinone/menaquinone biosynthesis C-methylase UbiE